MITCERTNDLTENTEQRTGYYSVDIAEKCS